MPVSASRPGNTGSTKPVNAFITIIRMRDALPEPASVESIDGPGGGSAGPGDGQVLAGSAAASGLIVQPV
jgi:hypothetical protein